MRSTHELVSDLDQFDPRLMDQLALEAMLLIERWRQMDTATDITTNEHEVKSVRQALINLVDRSGRCPTPILAPLAALRDPDLVSLLRRCLLYQMADQNAGGVYAAMYALEEAGENLFEGRSSRSILDWELNRSLAKAYLERHSDTRP